MSFGFNSSDIWIIHLNNVVYSEIAVMSIIVPYKIAKIVL